MALVLAVGNVLNEGKRTGNAYGAPLTRGKKIFSILGFQIDSLDQISSVRSALRSDRNLMHWLAEVAERKLPDLLRLRRELACVGEAARVDRGQLEVGKIPQIFIIY